VAGSLLTVALLCTTNALGTPNITIMDDHAFPQSNDWDFGLSATDIQLSNPSPAVGEPVTIVAGIHNLGLGQADSAWGWYSPNGRSCWGEWDFNSPATETVDISYRCRDDVTVDWRVELDGVHLGSPSVPGVGTGTHWKTVTLHDVPITAGPHTVFLGTYQMDYYPDYRLDWVQIGDQRIEAETYDRMGGNDPNPDLRGLTIWPREVAVRVWDGLPNQGTLLFEGPVGDTNTVIDSAHQYPGYTWPARYISNNSLASVAATWIPSTGGWHDLYVQVDPAGTLTEIDEMNNIAHLSVWVPEPASTLLLGLGAGLLLRRLAR
jgi:hypothetical protein